MTPKQTKAIAELRESGHAVTVLTPSALSGVSAQQMESEMYWHAVNLIRKMKSYPEPQSQETVK